MSGAAEMDAVMALSIAMATASRAGRGHSNQDAVGACWTANSDDRPPQLMAAIADGIGSSDVSGEAARACVAGFISDFPCTPTVWSSAQAGQQVIRALGARLQARTRASRYREDMNRGYVCSFSALVACDRHIDLFHVGDTRIYRGLDDRLVSCTDDHRVPGANGGHHLAAALGADAYPVIDHCRLAIAPGDVFVMASDGAYEAWDEASVLAALAKADPQAAADAILDEAQARDDRDDASVIVLRINDVPQGEDHPAQTDTPVSAPVEPLAERTRFAGFTIIRTLTESARSRVYLAHPSQTPAQRCVIKIPGPETAADAQALERFWLEGWVAARIDNPHVMKALASSHDSDSPYLVFEYIQGQTLDVWRQDQRRPSLAAVRAIIDQSARGLLAFHRQQMLHQDLRPANIMLDEHATARIIDFGAVRIAGIEASEVGPAVPGTEQFAAPEYFAGEAASPAADQYSLAAVAYYLLTGELPYGPNVSRATTRAAQQKLSYRPITERRPDIAPWVDAVIRRAVHVDPARRYEDVARFVEALSRPPMARDTRAFVPWIERDPVRLWQITSAVLALAVAALGVIIGLSHSS